MPLGQNEAFSRVLIDKPLEYSDWNLLDQQQVQFEFHTSSGRADYLLKDSLGRVLCVLEAKRENRDPYEAKEQAHGYAENLKAPFVILSNGREHWIWNYERADQRDAYRIERLPSRDDLERLRLKNLQPPRPLGSEVLSAGYLRRQKPDLVLRRYSPMNSNLCLSRLVIARCFLILPILAATIGRGASEARIDSAIEFQPGIAPIVAQSRESFAEAAVRFSQGLPTKAVLHVAVRLVDAFDRPELAWIHVLEIDKQSSTIQGRISSDVHAWTGWSRKDHITCHTTDVIGWKIVHADGTEEGNALGKFLAAQGAGLNPFDILEDKRKSDLTKFSESAAVSAEMDKLFLRIFGDDTLHIEHVKSPVLEEWPSLVQRFRDVPRKQLVASIKRKAEELKASAGVIVEDSGFLGKSLVIVTGSLVMTRGAAGYKVDQFLQLDYDGKDKLDHASWGIRSIRTVHLKPAADKLPEPAPASGVVRR